MFFLVIILIIGSFDQTISQCNICGTNSKSACLSRTAYQICDADKIINSLGIFYCPYGMVCVDDSFRCVSAETAKPACGAECEVCDPQTHVACINEDTFAFCFVENGVPSRVLGFCEIGKVCNVKSSVICVDQESMEPTCPDYTRTTATPNPTTTVSSTTHDDSTIPTLSPTLSPSTPDDFCEEKRKIGKYPIPGNCNRYTICMMSGNYWIGREYNCYRGGVFDCKIGQCVINGDCDYSCLSAKP